MQLKDERNPDNHFTVLHDCTILYLNQIPLIKHARVLMEMLQKGIYHHFYSCMKGETVT